MPLTGSLGGFAGPYGAVQAVPTTYTLTLVGGGTDANEGGNLQILLSTTGVANGVVIPYTTSGTADANDFTAGSLSGNFTVNTTGTYPNGTATISFQVKNDNLTEGTENLRINAAGQSILVNLIDLSLSAPMWIVTTGNSGDASARTLAVRGMAVTANGDTYSLYANGSTSNAYFQRLYPNNAVAWTKKFTANTFHWASSVEVEQNRTTSVNADAIYFAGYAGTSGANVYAYVTKANTSGGVTWQRQLTVAGGFDMNGMSADHTGLALVEFTTLVKYNTSGTVSWQKNFSAIPSAIMRTVLCRESYTYVPCEEFSGSTGYNHFFKYDSSGNIVWKKKIGIGTNAYTTCEGLDTDTNGDIYAVGRMVNTTGSIMDIDPNGNIAWARRVNGYEMYDIVYSNKDGYLYALGVDAANPYSLIIKMDIYGNVIWQRRFTPTVINNPRESRIRVDHTLDYIYVTHIQGGVVAKLNTDGSGGSMDSYTYQNGAATIDDITSSITNVNSTYTPSAGGATSSAITIALSNYDNTLVQYRHTY